MCFIVAAVYDRRIFGPIHASAATGRRYKTPHNLPHLTTGEALVENEAGRGHDLAVTDKGDVFLRAGRSAKNVTRIDREIDQETGHFLPLAHVQFARSRLAQEFNLRASRIAQAGVEPSGDDFLVLRRVGAVNRIRGWRSFGLANRGKEAQEQNEEERS